MRLRITPALLLFLVAVAVFVGFHFGRFFSLAHCATKLPSQATLPARRALPAHPPAQQAALVELQGSGVDTAAPTALNQVNAEAPATLASRRLPSSAALSRSPPGLPRASTRGAIPPLPGGEEHYIGSPAGPLQPPTADAPFSVIIGIILPSCGFLCLLLLLLCHVVLLGIAVNFQESALPATIASLLTTPGQQMINEILIIDDFSQPPVGYSEFTPADNRIRVWSAPHRLGLIRARVMGGNLARGPFLVFIDAHVTVRPDWLAPVASLLQRNRKRLVNMEVGMLDANVQSSKSASSGPHPPTPPLMRTATFLKGFISLWEPAMSRAQIRKLSGSGAESDPDQSPMTMGTSSPCESVFLTECD